MTYSLEGLTWADVEFAASYPIPDWKARMPETYDIQTDQFREVPLARGTVVYLKSGSPPLVVYEVGNPPDHAQVEWFSGGDVRRDAFPLASLTTEKPDAP